VVGVEGIAAFDGLSSGEKDQIGATKTFFLHQSVGENIVDGAASLGFDFEWVDSGSDYDGTILGERVTDAQNKDPLGKLGDYDRFMIANEIGAQAQLAGLKFCYSDLSEETDMNAVRAKYAETISKIESAYPSIRLYMITPPIHQDQEDWLLEEENKIRLDFGQWLVDTYSANHIIYDLAAVESTREDGTTCTYGSVKVLCSEYWDGSSGSHLNATGQVRAAKAFLFALHKSRTL